MSERRVLLAAAAFVDSRQALSVTSAPTADIRTIAQRYVAACIEDLGKAPRLLDGDEVGIVLTEVLPRRYGAKDPLAAVTAEVLAAYLDFLGETEVVTHAYEQRRALDAHADAFETAVASGAAHAEGIAITGKGTTVVHKAAKVSRNDPCPCGSGKKFKKCCMRLGEGG